MNDMKYFVLKSDKCVTESTQKLNKTGKGAINYRQITAKWSVTLCSQNLFGCSTAFDITIIKKKLTFYTQNMCSVSVANTKSEQTTFCYLK